MNRLPRFALWTSIAVAGAFCVAVCHQKQFLSIPDVSAAVASAQDQAPPDQGQDPAAVNMAPSGASYTTQAPPPADQTGAAPGPEDQDYAEQPTATASQPPPPLPDYDQPPAPGDGYLWTPGYWSWGRRGYYWVPGAWVEAPYEGALWTPGYWGFYGGNYLFYPGYWGRHIGFYGGIHYGFGYIGVGYEGGYWNHGHFAYNREYNRVDERVVHNVYSYKAGNRGNYGAGGNGNGRVSYRGGNGGVQARPQPSEAAAWREPTAPRMTTQVQHAQSFQTNRGQIAANNHGQPRTAAVSRPVHADRNVTPTVRAQSNSRGQHR